MKGLDSIYYRAPVWMQNVIASGKGFQLKRQRYHREFFRQLEALKRSEWLSSVEIANYQNEKIHNVAKDVYENVPYYRKVFDKLGIRPDDIQCKEDLGKLPLVTKKIIRQSPNDFLSRVIPPGKRILSMTSGTTGSPLAVYLTKDALAFQWAIWWRHKARFGLNPGDSHLMFGARPIVDQRQSTPPFWRFDCPNRRTYLSTHHIRQDTLKPILEFLNRSNFTFFTGSPAAMNYLAALVEENGERLYSRPKCIVTGAEKLETEFESRISRVFGSRVTDQYGMAEFAGNLSRCENGRFHVDFECCVVEEDEVPGADSSLRKLILTGWGNPVMPLLRYDIGDYVRLPNGKCMCGRESPSYLAVEGRMADHLVTPSGQRVIGMSQIFKCADGVNEAQIYQAAPDVIEVRLVTNSKYSLTQQEVLEREFRKRLGNEIVIKFIKVCHIARLPNGKFRSVISEVEAKTN